MVRAPLLEVIVSTNLKRLADNSFTTDTVPDPKVLTAVEISALKVRVFGKK